MKKIGISILDFQNQFDDFKAIKIAKDIGADAVDFNLWSNKFNYWDKNSIYSKDLKEFDEYFLSLKNYADSLGIEISQTHGNGTGFKNNPEEDNALLKNIELDCRATRILGAPICVIHNATTIFLGKDAPSKLMQDLSYNLFVNSVKYAKENNIKIATETFGDATGHDCVDFFGQINEFLISYNRIKAIKELSDYFTICVDTGHSNKAMRFGNPTPANVIRMCGRDVLALHLNDNDTLTDQHKTPWTGCIDWDDVFNALDEIGYDGVYNMELNLRHFGEDFSIEEGKFAIKVLRHFIEKRYN